MKIRTRLTIWYAGVFFVSALVIGGVAYNELVTEKRVQLRRLLAEKEGDQTAAALLARIEREEPASQDLFDIGLWFGLPAALLAIGGGWFFTRQALAPVTALSQAAARISEHHLRETLPRTGSGDELDRLTETFNAMTARLDGSFQRIREFTLHASHELKTPLTVLRGEFEAALDDPALPAVNRERCATQLEEVERLTKIVDGLTLLTKADAGQVTLNREPVRLDELLRDAFADAQILAAPRQVKVALDHCEPLTVTGDRNRLRQLLLNLADNAVKYSQPGGSVSLALRADKDHAEAVVANTGPGVPPEQQPRVFDRFFRGDASHCQDTEGCGLGLSIAQWIVTAHGGSIRFASEPGKLTTVSVRLPLLKAADRV